MAVIEKDLGPVSAYAVAVAHGYTGTEAEWEALIANSAINAQSAGASATAAAASAQEAAQQKLQAQAQATAALAHAQDASRFSQTAGQANSYAQMASSNAAHSATNASNAQTAAEAAQAAAEAAVTGAEAAQTAAEAAVTDAQTAKTAAETAAATAAAAYGTDLLADDYSTSKTYAVGDYVIYSGNLYRCTTAIATAESWTAAHWTQAQVGPDLNDLKSANAYNTVHDLLSVNKSTTTNGIEWAWTNRQCHVSGTPAAASLERIFWIDGTQMPPNIQAGKTYFYKFTSTGSKVRFRARQYVNGTGQPFTDLEPGIGAIEIGSDTNGMQLAFVVPSTAGAVDETIGLEIFNAWPNSDLFGTHFIIPSGKALSTVTAEGHYLLDSTAIYPDSPFGAGRAATLEVLHTTDNTVLQRITAVTGGAQYMRTSVLGVFPATWVRLAVDKNDYISAPGDMTDMTSAIQTMLNTSGVCRLGPGDFYVTGVEVPNYGMLIGSGNATHIVLASSVTSGYAVKLLDYGCIKDMRIDGLLTGSVTDMPSTVGTRHGILYQGTATDSSAADSARRFYGCVENCFIAGFSGGGFTLTGSGGRVNSNLLVSDCHIRNCAVGVNVAFFAEFCRFTNVSVTACYYGCIDNGGNDNFVNCSFSGCMIGILMDNSTGQSYNSSHGTFDACTVCHSGANNNGTAIRILGMTAGEIFTGMQIFFGAIDVEDSVGVRFIGCNFGRSTPLTVKNSTVVTFDHCTMYDASNTPLTSMSNTALVFDGCYTRAGTTFNPN